MSNLFGELSKKNDFNSIIYINIIFFICINLYYLIMFLFQTETDIITYLGVSSNIEFLISRPWTLFTYMFIHEDIFHIIINLCWFYFGGTVFTNYLSSSKIFSTYLMGGMIGALFYIISFNIFPVFENLKTESLAIGASASVLSILFAAATHVPKFSVKIVFFGNINLKYIAIIALIIDILSIPKGNAGGHIAHLGGAFYGTFYIYMKKRHINTNYIFDHIINLFSKKTINYYSKRENDYQYNARKRTEQKQIDSILDKISKSGYDSLDDDEKEKLLEQK